MTNKSLEFTTDPAMFHNHFSRNVRTLNTSVNSRLAYFWDFTDTGGERRGEKKPTRNLHTPRLLVSQPKRGCVGGRLAGNAVRAMYVT